MNLLGLALGGHISPFKIMRGLIGEDAEIDIALTNSEVEQFGLFGKGIGQTVIDTEKDYLDRSNVNDYFNKPLELPWRDLISTVILDPENGSPYEPDIENYDFLLVSTTDSFFKPTESFVAYVREEYPEVKIVIGGSGVRQSTLESIQELNPDYINMGSCDAFVNYLKTGKFSDGLYARKNNAFFGKGTARPLKISTFEELEKTGFITKGYVGVIEEDDHGITVMGSDDDYIHAKLMGISSCTNACDYCSSRKGLEISSEVWKKSIEKSKEKYDLDGILLQIWDDNPWIHPEKYFPVFKTILDNFNKVRVEGYIDPLALTQKDSKKMFDTIYSNKKLESTGWFVGRECCDEKASEILGRRFKGKIRNQKHLETERKIIEEVIKKSEKLDLSKMMISYVIGPGESEKSVELRFREIDQLGKLSDKIEFQTQTLKAYPGTRAWKKYNLLYKFPGIMISNIDDFFNRCQ